MTPFKKDHAQPVSIWLLVLLIGLTTASGGFSQTRPANDDLTNSTVLTGTEVTFSGSLAGATLEGAEATAFNSFAIGNLSNSIWWSWTAPVTTVLNLKLQQFPLPSYGLDGVAVYSATNGISSPSDLQPPLGVMGLWAGLQNQSLSIPVTAGVNYRIQLIGSGSNLYTFTLVATNAPLILKQPLSHTVYSNASVLFYVISGGLQPRTYQWFCNGTNLPGETTPILAFNQINASQVGDYSVLISNASGTVMSQPATLDIGSSNAPIGISAFNRQSNVVTFNLTLQQGQGYRISSSADMIHWTDENFYPITPQLNDNQYYDNLVYATNSPLPLTFTNNAPTRFFRAAIDRPDSPHSEICINNLRQILIAKLLWQLDNNFSPTKVPFFQGFKQYFAYPSNLFCPDDRGANIFTSYSFNDLTTFPTCEINSTNHILDGLP